MKQFLLPLVLLASPALAESADTLGTLNPEEMSWGTVVSRAANGETSMTVCASGYMMTKSGDHSAARTIFEACAADGYTAAMTWMGQLDNNGLGGEYSPDAAAAWDRRAAETGDPVGKFNYGIDLMRGHGAPQDEALGRQLVAEAAQDGLVIAQRLEAANFDLEEVTPDADNWKYAPLY